MVRTMALGRLFKAAGDGDIALVRRLVRLGADVKERDLIGGTVLHWAADHGQVDVMLALVALGADKEAVDAAGLRPLHWAAVAGRLAAVRALLYLDAAVDAQTHDGRTAHAISLKRGHAHVAELLEAAAQSRDTEAAARSDSSAGASSAAPAPSKTAAFSTMDDIKGKGPAR